MAKEQFKVKGVEQDDSRDEIEEELEEGDIEPSSKDDPDEDLEVELEDTSLEL